MPTCGALFHHSTRGNLCFVSGGGWGGINTWGQVLCEGSRWAWLIGPSAAGNGTAVFSSLLVTSISKAPLLGPSWQISFLQSCIPLSIRQAIALSTFHHHVTSPHPFAIFHRPAEIFSLLWLPLQFSVISGFSEATKAESLESINIFA